VVAPPLHPRRPPPSLLPPNPPRKSGPMSLISIACSAGASARRHRACGLQRSRRSRSDPAAMLEWSGIVTGDVCPSGMLTLRSASDGRTILKVSRSACFIRLRVIFNRRTPSPTTAACRRVFEDVTTLAPHRPERARFTHSVPHARASLTMSWMPLEPSCAIDTH
jgi:hypothetical protein